MMKYAILLGAACVAGIAVMAAVPTAVVFPVYLLTLTVVFLAAFGLHAEALRWRKSFGRPEDDRDDANAPAPPRKPG
jgi:hypothetical protein